MKLLLFVLISISGLAGVSTAAMAQEVNSPLTVAYFNRGSASSKQQPANLGVGAGQLKQATAQQLRSLSPLKVSIAIGNSSKPQSIYKPEDLKRLANSSWVDRNQVSPQTDRVDFIRIRL